MRCAQTRKARMYAVARKDMKGMELFAEVNTSNDVCQWYKINSRAEDIISRLRKKITIIARSTKWKFACDRCCKIPQN